MRRYVEGVARKFETLRREVFAADAAAFPPRAFNLAVYRWATAVVDSRAIWWNNKRHLVPMLDLVNCAEGPDAGRVHATRLTPAGEYAVTRADRPFAAGSQVFENYGQPNWRVCAERESERASERACERACAGPYSSRKPLRRTARATERERENAPS